MTLQEIEDKLVDLLRRVHENQKEYEGILGELRGVFEVTAREYPDLYMEMVENIEQMMSEKARLALPRNPGGLPS